MRFVVAAGQTHLPPKGAVMIFGGLMLVAFGITAIVSPGAFRNYPANPDQTPRPVWQGHDAVTRGIGVAFCAMGLPVLILGIVNLASGSPTGSAGGTSGRTTNPVITVLIFAAALIITVINGIRLWTRRRRRNDSLTDIDDSRGSR